MACAKVDTLGINLNLDKRRTEVREQAKDLALTGTFENFDKVVQALRTLGLNAGLDPHVVLARDRGTINKLCRRGRPSQ